MNSSHIRRAVVALTIAATVVALGSSGVAVTAADGPPPAPLSLHGEVEIDSEPAPAGTEIVALVDGDERATIVTETNGSYGGPAIAADKLVVDGDSSTEGETVSFLVNGDRADQTIVWEPGVDRELDLSVGDPSATDETASPIDSPGGSSSIGSPDGASESRNTTAPSDGAGELENATDPSDGADELENATDSSDGASDRKTSADSSTDRTDDSDDGMPGFTAVSALVAFAAVAVVFRVGTADILSDSRQ